ncbi:polysaccharide deacetylase family protein [Phenylobacterium sp.]|uniref:polysaccharide deacetylase family protein n=1 Tax=Phenylobacterium sp. TaxID=1871053 RepID=UPI002DE5CE74|nr:polysaccharide deacetylase family protein [Phenylobacterium sp.]
MAAAVGLAVVAGAALGLYQLSRARCFALGLAPICRVATSRPEVALTFDDGPTADGLAAILPELERRQAHATFFLIGADVAKHPAMVATLLAAGQEVGDHSFSHVRMVGRSARFYDQEIERTQAALKAAGAEARFFRPPYGKKLMGLPLAVKRHGLAMIIWDVEDPATTDPRAFADEIVRQAHPGAIILVHAMYPTNRTARAALPMILDGLTAKGLRIVTVGDLIADAR